MSVETVAGLNNILKNHNSSSWIQKNELAPMSGNSWENLKSSDSRSFSDILKDSIKEVDALQKNADTAVQRLVTGKSKNIHETMLAVEKAEIAFKMMNQIRFKVIDAYKEVMRMQI